MYIILLLLCGVPLDVDRPTFFTGCVCVGVDGVERPRLVSQSTFETVVPRGATAHVGFVDV